MQVLLLAKYGIGNTKFNYAVDYDINLDGYKDIVIAVTRGDPYYVGKGLQVFLNTYDSETGNRKFIPGDNLLPNEGSLDSFHGEGQLSVVDINNDGIINRDEMLTRQQSRFDMLDSDKDGMIAPAEYNAKMVSMFEKLDTNGDGLLQPDELPRRHHHNHHYKHKR